MMPIRRNTVLCTSPRGLQTKKAASRAHEVLDYLHNTEPFNQAEIGFLRDAWAAARFAELRNATAVQLVSDEWPDFNVRFNPHVEQFECVEADVLRHCGMEYRDAEDNPVREGPIEDRIERPTKCRPF